MTTTNNHGTPNMTVTDEMALAFLESHAVHGEEQSLTYRAEGKRTTYTIAATQDKNRYTYTIRKNNKFFVMSAYNSTTGVTDRY